MWLVLTILGAAVLVIPAAIIEGWALSVLWGWFLVPTLKVSALTIPQAIGVALTVRAVINVEKSSKPNEQWWAPLMALFGGPIIVVGLGWIVKQWL